MHAMPPETARNDDGLVHARAAVRAMIDIEPLPVTVVDVETLGYVDVNLAACRMLGYDRETMLAQGALGSYVGLPAQALHAHYAEIVRQAPTPFEQTTVFWRSDGVPQRVHVTRRAFMLMGRWCILVRSVPQAPPGEDDAAGDMGPDEAESEELTRYRHLLRTSDSAITLADYRTEQYLDVNEAACRLIGQSRETLMAWGPARTLGLTPEQLRVMYGTLTLSSPQPSVVEMQFDDAKRGRVHLLVTRFALLAGGRWVIFSSLQDQTARREAERELQRLRLAIDQAADSVIVIDAQTCEYLYINETACRRVGYTHAEHMALRPWLMDERLISREHTQAMYQRLIAMSPQVQTSEGDVRRKDGSVMPMELTRSAVELDGRWVIVVTGRDITERKKAEAQLRQHMRELERSNQELERSNQDLERFAYVASHDLSEPLRMVASYTQLLERRYGPKLDDEAREFIGFAVDGARRMKRLIDDLLTYSRAGRADRPLREVDMNAVLADALKNLEQLIAEKAARIERDELPRVRGDATALAQLMQNLVGNAMKFVNGRAPSVRVTASPGEGDDADRWTVRVQDNGVGIEPRYYGRIFDLFQRLHTQDKFQGTGLGLAICKKIVERHGGRIWVESVPGQGSSFYFTLGGAAPPAAGEGQ